MIGLFGSVTNHTIMHPQITMFHGIHSGSGDLLWVPPPGLNVLHLHQYYTVQYIIA